MTQTVLSWKVWKVPQLFLFRVIEFEEKKYIFSCLLWKRKRLKVLFHPQKNDNIFYQF
jgi:hypothetical protein